jgi:hypothetical protein
VLSAAILGERRVFAMAGSMARRNKELYFDLPKGNRRPNDTAYDFYFFAIPPAPNRSS